MLASASLPDLVLLDIMMPGMDGYQVFERMQADERLRTVPVIFLTAMHEPQDEERGLALGAMDYITKPASPAIVLARVRNHIELKRARDRLAGENLRLEAEVARRVAASEPSRHRRRIALYVETLARLLHVPELSAGIRGMNHLRMAQEFARWRAERWDGTGYPQGLGGDQIPMSARLVAAAEAFDLLTGEQARAAQLTPAQVRERLEANRGRHLDPQVADALLAHFDKFMAIADQTHP